MKLHERFRSRTSPVLKLEDLIRDAAEEHVQNILRADETFMAKSRGIFRYPRSFLAISATPFEPLPTVLVSVYS